MKSILAGISLLLVLGLGAACEKSKGLRITSVEPKSGPSSGGGYLIVHGSGFSNDGLKQVDVYFGDTKARAFFESDDVIKVEIPAGPAGKTVGLLFQFGDARTLEYPNAYTYTELGQPLNVDALVKPSEPAK